MLGQQAEFLFATQQGLFGGYFATRLSDEFFMQMAYLSVGGLVGYLAPTFWLKFSIKANAKAKLVKVYQQKDGKQFGIIESEAALTVTLAQPCAKATALSSCRHNSMRGRVLPRWLTRLS